MKEQFIRTAMLLGEEGIDMLQGKRVAIFGVGGVGGHAIEALARSGIGAIDLIDNDVVAESNINRQIIATHETVGRKKTEVMKERIATINPSCQVSTYDLFYLPENCEQIPFASFDYIMDAIDTVTAKIDLVLQAKKYSVPIISSMGTGNKLDPSKLRIGDIYETSVCPLAKVMRKELRAREIQHLKVVYSLEEAQKPKEIEKKHNPKEIEETPQVGTSTRRATPGSISYVPAVAGLYMAGEVIRDFIELGN